MVFIEKIYQDRTSLLDFYVFVLWYDVRVETLG